MYFRLEILLLLYIMSKQFEIINSQVIFVYQRSMNIRKRQFEFEDALNDLFNVPFNSIAIGDDQDGNIPRFEAQSRHGFSKLQTSQFRTNLITNFRDEYKLDLEKVSSYLSERISILKALIKKEKLQFCAFIIELGFEFNSNEEINKILKEHTGANCLNGKSNDFSLLYSQEYQDDYFLNIKCSKYKESRFKVVKGVLVEEGKSQKQGISVILDINSKLAFNKKKNYTVDIIDDLEKETFKMLSNYKLEDYLKGI